jgi:uridine phosphorylase
LTQRTWYLNCGAEDVGDRAILVGDRERVGRVAARLTDVRWLNEDRGLTTATGRLGDRTITVSAFGMGAPIAAIVLHELRSLGVGAFLRLGTVMSLPPVEMGDLVIADGAVRGESTSAGYVPDGFPAVGDHELGAALRSAAGAAGARWHAGLVDSRDGFYTHMLGAGDRHATLAELGVLALDMETSAILAVGRALGARAGSLCAATVDAVTGERLDAEPREEVEERLVDVGLEALAACAGIPREGARL